MTKNQEIIAQTKKRVPHLLNIMKVWIAHEKGMG